MAGISNISQTEDPGTIVNNVFLTPCCEEGRMDSALCFALRM